MAERAWGTVREDYSDNGDAWRSFPHEHAHLRAYRWNEDGLGGFCNRFQNLCMATAFWNGQDPILKERMFGLAGPQGNHGEDVKELYWYLDSTPTHSYCKMQYIYPHSAFPYRALVEGNQRRGRDEPEFELADALAEDLAAGRYFDITIEWAKAGEEDLRCRIRCTNRGPEVARLCVLPQLWFRNTWAWGHDARRPTARGVGPGHVRTEERHIQEHNWVVGGPHGPGTLLFTDNDTNVEAIWGESNPAEYVKDAFHRRIVEGQVAATNPAEVGTKVGALVELELGPGQSEDVRVRFGRRIPEDPFDDFEAVFETRRSEADAFYATLHPAKLDGDQRSVQRQAWAGLMWNKQFYHYAVDLWLDGDPGHPPPPAARKHGRNAAWRHCYHLDILSMPDCWEYPWFAAWDTAFHTLPLAEIDPQWAKRQLVLLMREWYMHPNGQIPAYEWRFEDVNPPVHAWACWRVYQISAEVTGVADRAFLARTFHKLLMNFTWWVNRKDAEGRNVFEGGFLGLDNIGVFDRSMPLPGGGHIEQADGTAWMGMFCLNMLVIALELAQTDPAYEDVATKFFEHFVYIASAIRGEGGSGGLWDAEDGFFYDVLRSPDGVRVPLRTRSTVGLIPLLAVETIDESTLATLPRFRRRMEWFLRYRPHLAQSVASFIEPGHDGRRLLSFVREDELRRVMSRLLDEEGFLSDYGIRSLSKAHEAEPFSIDVGGVRHTIGYEPAESRTPMFGGNSNWRGPIWFPTNYLLIESLGKYHDYYGDALTVPLPTAGGPEVSLDAVARDLGARMTRLFTRKPDGNRPVHGDCQIHRREGIDEAVTFYEYFHGDDGRGLGASHQTGWTALVARLLGR